jgi:hypothetical protein
MIKIDGIFSGQRVGTERAKIPIGLNLLLEIWTMSTRLFSIWSSLFIPSKTLKRKNGGILLCCEI